MLHLSKIFVVILILFIFSCGTDREYRKVIKTDKNGYSYEIVENDPIGLRVYTLKNGLKVYLAVNKNEPRIMTLITVKAGSTYDPADNTGLAHYLEHLMFKGTDEFGTIDWEKEKTYLQEISELYELHKKTENPAEKKRIYAKIDSISQIAAKYAIANEYDKMCALIGAKMTNAYTSNERTVYMNDIPSNELERWCILEKERFSKLVLRLFHTELETVYEEFNMYQDRDEVRANETLMRHLFPKHPYGQQTTIGKAEHLKNPSMINIENYFNTFYVPNNMAICLVGDLDPDETIKIIDKYFGVLEPNDELPKIEHPKEEEIKNPIELEVFGPQPEFVDFAFRLNGIHSDDKYYALMIDMILNNAVAGLIDINLVKKQKVLEAYSDIQFLRDYGMHWFSGKPKEGQKLEEVKDLILAEIEKVKKGEFEDWLIDAILTNLKISRIKSFDSRFIAFSIAENFANDIEWQEFLESLDKLAKIKKNDIIEFAKKNYNNYVLVYKRIGKDPNIVKVEKPMITPIKLNRDNESKFVINFKNIQVKPIEPVFVDFKKSINFDKLNDNIEFHSIQNTNNELFSLYFIFAIGSEHSKDLPIAIEYAPYIGTEKYSLEELNKEFYRYGISFGVDAQSRRSYIYISGIDEFFEKGIELIEHAISSYKPDNEAYKEYVNGIIKKRENSKLEKDEILWNGLYNWGKFGENSPFRDIYKNDELKQIKPEKLTEIIKNLFKYNHQIFYYGPRKPEFIKKVITKWHKPDVKLEYPQRKKYIEKDYDKSYVFFANYDMVQSNLILLAKNSLFDASLIPASRLFNEYYGSGMSSIVFQEIRESKGLAYAVYAGYSIAYYPDNHNYVFGFLGTQPDKLQIATDALLTLLDSIPESKSHFTNSQESILRKIESERIVKENIYWSYIRNKDMGIDYDYRQKVYEFVKNAKFEDINKFFSEHVKNHNYIYLIIGDKKRFDWKQINKLGEVKEIPLDVLFNY